MNTANSPDGTPRPRRRFWRKLVVSLLSLVALTLVSLLVRHHIRLVSAQRELEETIAAISSVEPLVFPADLDAGRQPIADRENSALPIEVAALCLPKDWPAKELTESVNRLSPVTALRTADLQLLNTELGRAERAVRAIQQLPDLPQGRFPIVWSADYVSTGVAHFSHVRKITTLQELQALQHAEAGDTNSALRDLRGAINAGRSLNDEPMMISQLVRVAGQSMALRGLERSLAQGVADPTEIQKTRERLEDEARQPLLEIAVRGERAGIHQIFAALENGDTTLNNLADGPAATGLDALEERANQWLARPEIVRAHAYSLRYATRLLEVARLPPEQWLDATTQLDVDFANAPSLGRLLVPGLAKAPGACCRSQARLRCAIVALAVEQYRTKLGTWPESLDRLCPEFLAGVPLDPYDGQPLRYHLLQDGVIVYSVGPDRIDNGGKLDRINPVKPGTDLGFQLWTSEKRAHKPPTRKAE